MTHTSCDHLPLESSIPVFGVRNLNSEQEYQIASMVDEFHDDLSDIKNEFGSFFSSHRMVLSPDTGNKSKKKLKSYFCIKMKSSSSNLLRLRLNSELKRLDQRRHSIQILCIPSIRSEFIAYRTWLLNCISSCIKHSFLFFFFFLQKVNHISDSRSFKLEYN